MSENESTANEPREDTNPESKAGGAPGYSDSFTQVFESLKKEEGVPRRRNDSGLNGGFGTAGPPNAPQADAEGFTQIFESVKGKRQSTPLHSESVRFPAGDSVASPALNPKNSEGDFTRLMRKVSRKANTAKSASPVPAAKTALRADGPGEFTRIVSQSLRRDARSQGQNKGLPEMREPVAAPPDKGGAQNGRSPSASQSRAGTPEANSAENMEQFQPRLNSEQASGATPINPQAVHYSTQEAVRIAGGGASSLPRAAEQVASRSSNVKNAPAPRLVSESRFQEYVPLLLMANLFLTVLLLLLVGFALLHRP